MKAIVYDRYGPPDVLHLGEAPMPECGDGDMLIRVAAAEATKSDCELRAFRFPVHWFWLPLRLAVGLRRPKRRILGCYFSGEVVEVGREVSDRQAGDEVFGSAGLQMGGYGQYACLEADATFAAKPDNLSFEEAAALSLGGLNALHFIRELNVRQGEEILVNGAGGSIGLYGVQIAVARGANVTAVDRPDNESMLRDLGAADFIDYTTADFSRCGRQWDAMLDMVAGSRYSSCMRALKPDGRYATANPTMTKMLRSFLTNRIGSRKSIFSFARETREELDELASMAADGRIRPVIDRILPPEKAPEAHRLVETEQRVGMVVISLLAQG